MTLPNSAPRGRKVGRPKLDDPGIFTIVEAISRVTGLSVRAVTANYTLRFALSGQPEREWTVVGGASLRKRHSRIRAGIFKFAEQTAEKGWPELLRQLEAVVDLQVDEHIAAQGPEWRVSVQSYGNEIRKLRARQSRRGAVRHVKPKKPAPDK